MKATPKISRVRRPVEMRPVPGYEGLYSVTRSGRVWAHQKYRLAGRAGWRNTKGRWLKPSVHRSKKSEGYLFVTLYKDDPYKGRQFYVHHLVLMAWGPAKPSPKHECNHINLIKSDNRLDNLEWVLPQENIRHARSHGHIPHGPIYRGSEHAASKLTEAQVLEIRVRYAQHTTKHGYQRGETITELATEFGVHFSTIQAIITRKTWRHL